MYFYLLSSSSDKILLPFLCFRFFFKSRARSSLSSSSFKFYPSKPERKTLSFPRVSPGSDGLVEIYKLFDLTKLGEFCFGSSMLRARELQTRALYDVQLYVFRAIK